MDRLEQSIDPVVLEMAETVRQYADRRGLTHYKQIAKAAGVDQEVVRKFLKGETFPQIHNLLKIAATAGVPRQEILPDDYPEAFRDSGARELVLLLGKGDSLVQEAEVKELSRKPGRSNQSKKKDVPQYVTSPAQAA